MYSGDWIDLVFYVFVGSLSLVVLAALIYARNLVVYNNTMIAVPCGLETSIVDAINDRVMLFSTGMVIALRDPIQRLMCVDGMIRKGKIVNAPMNEWSKKSLNNHLTDMFNYGAYYSASTQYLDKHLKEVVIAIGKHDNSYDMDPYVGAMMVLQRRYIATTLEAPTLQFKQLLNHVRIDYSEIKQLPMKDLSEFQVGTLKYLRLLLKEEQALYDYVVRHLS